MNLWQKIGVGAGVAVLLGGGAALAVHEINKNVVTVQTGAVVRQDLTSLVTASGEVKPLTYTNVLGEGIGKITEIAVKEGDHVKKGDVLLRLESVQPAADVRRAARRYRRRRMPECNPRRPTMFRRRQTSSRARRIWSIANWTGNAARHCSRKA